MKKIVILLITIVSFPASALPAVECMGIYRNRTAGETKLERLKKSKIDPQYYEATLMHYSVGADFSFLPTLGIGLIVFNNTTKRSTNVTSGFRRIGTSKVMETDLKLYDVGQKGEDIVVGLQCNYVEP